jgi:hypothetical protein
VVPTVTVLAVMKARLIGATKGHSLLKKKADALNMRFRQVPSELSIYAPPAIGPLLARWLPAIVQPRQLRALACPELAQPHAEAHQRPLISNMF